MKLSCYLFSVVCLFKAHLRKSSNIMYHGPWWCFMGCLLELGGTLPARSAGGKSVGSTVLLQLSWGMSNMKDRSTSYLGSLSLK